MLRSLVLLSLLQWCAAFSPAPTSLRAPLSPQLPLVSPLGKPATQFHVAPRASPEPRSGEPVLRLGGGGFGGGGGFNPRDLVGPVIFASLIASGALGWLFNGILFLTLLPLIAGPIFSWYVQANLVEGACPECGSPVQVLKGQRGGCMTCGATMGSDLGSGNVFLRVDSVQREDGVVEVEVITDDY